MLITRHLLHSTILCGLVVAPAVALAAPQGGSVVGGSATITNGVNTVTIQQHTNKAIIDWNSFDIALNETARFEQPSSGSIALNRIRDSKASSINGQLTANGTVILVNQNGVVFGATSSVNVNSLVVSVADIDNDSFMNSGSAVFNRPGHTNSTIINHGTITVADAGLVGFVAPHVENQGTITGRMARVTMASGEGFTLDFAGDGISAVTITNDLAAQIVRNGGIIHADGGVIELTAAAARNAVDALVVNTGVLKADSVESRGGVIRLFAARGTVKNEGQIYARATSAGHAAGAVSLEALVVENNALIDVSGVQDGGVITVTFTDRYSNSSLAVLDVSGSTGRGGDIIVNGGEKASIYASGAYISDGATTGGRVDLFAGHEIILTNMSLSATGAAGGGNVRIGGDYQGLGNVRRVRNLIMDESSTIHADATDNGNGGRVILWADDTTIFGGRITANAGANGGDGGFIETSGKRELVLGGSAFASAPNGKNGHWLLDPADVTMDAAYVATVVASLNAGTDVTVDTTGSGGNGDITLTSTLTSTGNGDLTLSAARHIVLSSNITLGSGGNLTLNADNDGNGTGYVRAASLTTNNANITIGGGSGAITAGSGYAVGGSTNGLQYGFYASGSVNGGGGNIIINGQGGTYSSGSNYGIFTIGAIYTTGSGTITLNGTGGSAGNNNYGILVDYSTYSAQVYNSSGSGAITLNGLAGSGSNNYGLYLLGTTIGHNSVNYTGLITLTADGLGIYGDGGIVRTNNNNVVVSATGSNSNVLLPIINATGGAISITSRGYIYTGALTATGAITLNADSDGNADGSSTAGLLGYIFVNGNIASNGGNITLGGGANPAAGFARGSASNTLQRGVQVAGSVTAAGGNVIINGRGGAYSSGSNHGVLVQNTTSTTGTGTITINGTGGSAGNNNYGILVDNSTYGGAVTHTGSGAITLTGITGSGSNNYGLYLESNTVGGASASGNITLVTDNLYLSSNTIRTTGNITVKPYTNGTTVGVGTGSGALAISGTYLSYFNWGSSNTLFIGDATTAGHMEINYTTTFAKKVAFLSSGNITLSGNITSSVAGDAVVIAAGGNFLNSTNRTISLTNVGSKRWIIYSTQSSSDTPGGLSNANASGPYYGYTYGTLAPDSVGGSGNTWVYSVGLGTITFTADSLSRYYGDVNPALTYAFACSTGCSYEDAVASGSLSLTTAANNTSNAGTYTITAAVGTLTFNPAYSSYSINYVNGNLTVNAAPLTITASAVSGEYGSVSLNGSTGFSSSGLKNSETIGSVTLATNATTSTTGHYNYNATPWAITASAATGGTFNAANYNITYQAGELAISRKALTVTGVTASNRAYNGLTAAMVDTNDAAISGVINGDDAALVSGSATGNFSNENAGNGKTVTVSGFSLTGDDSGNYTVSNPTTTANISKVDLVITAANVSGEYGSVSLNGSTGFNSSGLQNGETVGSVTLTTNATISSSGHYNYSATPWTISASAATGGTFNASNYNVSYQNASTGLTVSRKELTITGVTAGSRAYNGLTNATLNTGSASLSGIVQSDSVTLDSSGATGAFVSADVANGITVNTSGFIAGGVDSANYTLSQPSLSANITRYSLTITANNRGKEYGDIVSFAGTEFNSSGLQNGETIGSVTLSSAGAGSSATVNTYSILASAATGGTFNAANYTIDYVDGVLTVDPKSINISADNISREYGLANPTLTFNCGTLVGSDVCGTGSGGIFSAAPSLTTLADISSSVAGGPYAINVSGGTLSNSNYTIGGYSGGLLSVTMATLTVAADNLARYYGANNPTLTYSVTGLRNGDLQAAILSGIGVTTAATAASNAGGYTLTMAATLNSSNYSLSLQNATLTVNPALLTVTPNAKTRVYGSNNPMFDGTITGFVLNDTENAIVTSGPTYSTAASNVSNVGSYSITSSGGSLSSGNYEFSYGTGTLTVGKAMLTVTADDKTKTYAQANPAFTGVITGFVLGQDESVINSMPIYSSAAGQYSVVGNYSISGSGASDNNYDFTYTSGTFTIDAADLTITADNMSRTYGAANPSFTYQITSGALALGDTLDAVTLSTAATSSSNVGTYAINASAASGTGLSNYTIAYLPGTLTVDPATLTITPDNISKTYGASDPALTYSTSGLVNSDTASVLSGVLSRASGNGVGSYAISQGSLAASNYTINLTAGRSLTINPANLLITANNASKGYGSTHNFAGTEFSTSGLQYSDAVDSLTLTSTGAVNSASAGTYAIVASAATGSSFNASNYNISYQNGVLTVTPATLTISPNSYTITYGDAAPSYSGSYSGELLGDTFTVAYSPSAYSGNAGTYSITGSASGSNLSNYTVVNNAATLTVNKASLSATAQNTTRAYGTSNSFSVSYTGWKNSDNASVFSGAAGFTTSATAGSDIGTYSFTPTLGTLSALNYDITTFVPGTLTITRANMVVTPSSFSRTYGVANPSLEGVISGLYAPDNITANYATTATQQSGVGSYGITVSGLADPLNRLSNYDVTYATGSMSITPASLLVYADNKTRRQGEQNPAFTVTLFGLMPWDDASIFSGYTLGTAAVHTTPQGYYAINLSGGASSSNYAVTRYAGVLRVDAPVLPQEVIVAPVPTPQTITPTSSLVPVVMEYPANDNASFTNSNNAVSGRSGSAGAQVTFSDCAIGDVNTSGNCRKLRMGLGNSVSGKGAE
jgi:filamentous hemagglutinin family protein